MITQFLKKYEQKLKWLDATVFRDLGQVYTKDGINVFTDDWSKQEVTYEAACHGEMSPNDNNFHGSIKTIWRSKRSQYTTEAEQALYLLSLCDKVKESTIRKDWDRNFQLTRKNLNFKDFDADLARSNPKVTDRILRYERARTS